MCVLPPIKLYLSKQIHQRPALQGRKNTLRRRLDAPSLPSSSLSLPGCSAWRLSRPAIVGQHRHQCAPALNDRFRPLRERLISTPPVRAQPRCRLCGRHCLPCGTCSVIPPWLFPIPRLLLASRAADRRRAPAAAACARGCSRPAAVQARQASPGGAMGVWVRGGLSSCMGGEKERGTA
eukprot:1158611-Pelagomonas_calceolata.AAC.1